MLNWIKRKLETLKGINAWIASRIVQIIKTQIKRFYSHELVEYDKNVDPRQREDSEDKVIAT